jgi:hypothetical protein
MLFYLKIRLPFFKKKIPSLFERKMKKNIMILLKQFFLSNPICDDLELLYEVTFKVFCISLCEQKGLFLDFERWKFQALRYHGATL